MQFIAIAPYYLAWHYTEALSDMFRIFGNLIEFLWNLFSVPTLLSTLFSPWQRIHDENQGTFDLGNFLGNLIFNGIMRTLGFVVRLITVIIGISAIFLLVVLEIGCLFLWLILPFVIVWLFAEGLTLVIQSHP